MRKLSWTVTCVLACAAVGCTDSSTPIAPAPAASAHPGHASHETPPGLPRPEEGFPSALAEVRAATAAFHDPAEAANAGYLFGEPCHESAAGAMGIHAPNPALVRDGIIDPSRPEVLLYLPQGDGTLRLVGVEYMQTVQLRNPETGVIAPWRSQAPWPAAYEVVTPTPQLFGRTFEGPMAGHTATMPWHWDLHVWLWARNPDGMFAPWNPALRCS